MTDTMTPEQLAAIKARNEARKPGPWWTDAKYSGQEQGCAVIAARTDSGPLPGNPTRGMVCFVTALLNTEARLCEGTAAFIAHASEDLPALLAEVARLSDALAEAEKRVTEAACDVVDAYSEFDRPYCCDGRMCGCQGQSVHDMMKHFIRAMVRP